MYIGSYTTVLILLIVPVHNSCACLMVREDQSVSDDNILPSSSGKHNGFSDIFGGQWLTPAMKQSAVYLHWMGGANLRINSLRLFFVPIESHNGEIGFNLTRINTNDSNPLGDELLAHAFGE